MKDFTLQVYCKLLLALKQAGYSFYTFEEWCEGKAVGKYVILRHDVDRKPTNSLKFAQLENELGIRSSYYFRTERKIYNIGIIKQIAGLGHEIGYHYSDLVDSKGNTQNAITVFQSNLALFREFVSIKTIAMHGSPTSEFDNRDLWKTYNYRDYGIIGEPYLDFISNEYVTYFTDTARMWDGDKYNVRDRSTVSSKQQAVSSKQQAVSAKIHSTFDFINWLSTNPTATSMMVTTHPQRWTDNKTEWYMELILQSLKNRLKQLLILIR